MIKTCDSYHLFRLFMKYMLLVVCYSSLIFKFSKLKGFTSMDIRGFFSGAAKKTTVKQVVSVEKVTSMSDESPDIVTSTSIVTSSVVTEISKDSVTIPSSE